MPCLNTKKVCYSESKWSVDIIFGCNVTVDKFVGLKTVSDCRDGCRVCPALLYLSELLGTRKPSVVMLVPRRRALMALNGASPVRAAAGKAVEKLVFFEKNNICMDH